MPGFGGRLRSGRGPVGNTARGRKSPKKPWAQRKKRGGVKRRKSGEITFRRRKRKA